MTLTGGGAVDVGMAVDEAEVGIVCELQKIPG